MVSLFVYNYINSLHFVIFYCLKKLIPLLIIIQFLKGNNKMNKSKLNFN